MDTSGLSHWIEILLSELLIRGFVFLAGIWIELFAVLSCMISLACCKLIRRPSHQMVRRKYGLLACRIMLSGKHLASWMKLCRQVEAHFYTWIKMAWCLFKISRVCGMSCVIPGYSPTMSLMSLVPIFQSWSTVMSIEYHKFKLIWCILYFLTNAKGSEKRF